MTPAEMDEVCKKFGPMVKQVHRLAKTVVELKEENIDLATMLETACQCASEKLPYERFPAPLRDWYGALRAKQRGGDPVIGGRR